MAYNYDELYRHQRHALGEPSKKFIDFFSAYPVENARVLDLGCGQGRDALFIARLGHRVVAVDISASGIGQLKEDAAKENLAIDGVIADLLDYQPEGPFDIVIIDRTLHMLAMPDRLQVFEQILDQVNHGGFLLIADEKTNIPAFKNAIHQHHDEWDAIKEKAGDLFLKRC